MSTYLDILAERSIGAPSAARPIPRLRFETPVEPSMENEVYIQTVAPVPEAIQHKDRSVAQTVIETRAYGRSANNSAIAAGLERHRDSDRPSAMRPQTGQETTREAALPVVQPSRVAKTRSRAIPEDRPPLPAVTPLVRNSDHYSKRIVQSGQKSNMSVRNVSTSGRSNREAQPAVPGLGHPSRPDDPGSQRPSIRVTIGRIEVRSPPAAPPVDRSVKNYRKPNLSLADYLDARHRMQR